MSEVTFSDVNFQKDVLDYNGVVVVDFYAPWCGPCKMMAPSVEKLAVELNGKAIIGKVNVDENQEVSTKYDIRSIPTIIVFKNGQVMEQVPGFQSESALRSLIEKHL